MNVCDLLRSRAAAIPDAPAIIDARPGHGRVVSFAELEDTSARAAGLLHAAGLRLGDGVLVLLPMSADLYVALLAVFRLGLVALILDPSAGREHIERCCAMYPPQAVIAGARGHLLRLVSPALRRIPLKISVGLPVPGAVSCARIDRTLPVRAVRPCDPATPALLSFTSGSTGQPKATVRSHGFLLAQHRALRQSLDLAAGGVHLTTLPIFVLANLASGVTSLIPNVDLRRPDAIRPSRLADQMCAHRPARLIASPALLERLADHCWRCGVAFPSLRTVFTGGGPVFPRLVGRSAGSRLAPRSSPCTAPPRRNPSPSAPTPPWMPPTRKPWIAAPDCRPDSRCRPSASGSCATAGGRPSDRTQTRNSTLPAYRLASRERSS